MDNLLKIGIDQNTIDNMIDFNGIYDVEELNINYENTFRILEVLKKIKITNENINLMLQKCIDIFLMDYNKFIAKLRYADLSEVSTRINMDIYESKNIFLND